MNNKKAKYITNQMEKFPGYNIQRNFEDFQNLQAKTTSTNQTNVNSMQIEQVGEAKILCNNNLKPLRDKPELNYADFMLRHGNKSAGRGFGCLKTNEDLRFGIDSRKDRKDGASTDLTKYNLGL